MKTPGTPRRQSRSRLRTLKRAVRELGSRAIDRRTSVGRALTQWQAELVADLGGSESISTQQAALVDLAVKTKLMLDSIDAWLLEQPSLVNRRKRALLPVVRERTQLADALARYLHLLGLERRQKPPVDLVEYIANRSKEIAAKDRSASTTRKTRSLPSAPNTDDHGSNKSPIFADTDHKEPR